MWKCFGPKRSLLTTSIKLTPPYTVRLDQNKQQNYAMVGQTSARRATPSRGFCGQVKNKVKNNYGKEWEHKFQRSKKICLEKKSSRSQKVRRAQSNNFSRRITTSSGNHSWVWIFCSKEVRKKDVTVEDQINIRKKVYKENNKNQHRKKQPVATIVSELLEFMASFEPSS